ncbi:alkyldihydroxyacetonephosphate synthase [Panacagrimonas perspica]|uniref:Alkyldihydroxyacetonephosphate synthase n=1 Tax=Panacagrimonas perspica TaxID=381431 RepID=A0A4S3KAE7_9GAMM|nr:FAD-binding oxidoreductase [Panacagrimonas perspica]TDU32379.1 alkyldihydroxyacetonephosphate synthase [Panacagrimonas perspica]THD05310.1 FAD-binding oxidoreductase [Panacagrimonas perspica]
MRRWNGWGEDNLDYPLDAKALAFLAERIGVGSPGHEISLHEVLGKVRESSWTESGFDTSAETRLRHARGQSYRDWLALKYGRIGPVADAVALPANHAEVETVLRDAASRGARVVPWGGGTSVVGHLDVIEAGQPVLNLSLERMNALLDFDPISQLARFGAGTPGPRVEAQLRDRGYLLGHFPQSYEYSTVGGWVVTRSSGQQSLRYGRIENLFAGGRLVTPRGSLSVGGIPASSAGPDLRELVLGSEGRLGILSEAVVRVRKLPEREDFHAVFFPTWDLGVEAMRHLVQSDLPLSMLRLSNETETETQLTLAGHEKAIAWLKRYLKLRGSGARPVMMVFGLTGLNREVLRSRREALTLCKLSRGVHAGRMIGQGWAKNRFKGPYLRNGLWKFGYGADTVETCINWPQATGLMRAIEQTAVDAFAADNERIHAFTHLSHVYRQGCSIYSTFVFRSAGDHDADFARWQRLKARVSEIIVAHGGTISHQHGVGTDHAPYLEAEKGALGMDLLRACARELDPAGMMNPGKLFA